MRSPSLPGESFPSVFVPLYYLEALLRRGSYRAIAAEIVSRLHRGKILDVGTGPGLLPLELSLRSPELEVTGVDPSPGMIALARRLCGRGSDRVTFLLGGAYRLPFPPSSFDMVVSVGVLHHLLDPQRALREMCRVLKPGGEVRLYEVVMDVEGDEVARALREMEVPPFPGLPLFLIHGVLSRVSVGRRLVGLRSADLARVEGMLRRGGFNGRMERKGPLVRVLVRKGGG